MRKNLLLLTFGLMACANGYAQEDEKEVETGSKDTFNKWTIEASVGQSKGTRPYTTGYSSSNPNSVLGTVNLNYYNIGARYMFSPKFGVKMDVSYDKFENNGDTDSKPFEVDQYRVGIQGVVNASRLFNIEDRIGRFGLLVHAGLQFAWVTPQLDSGIDPVGGPSNEGYTEHNIGVMFGVSPQFRITKKLAIIGDFSTLANFRQHFAWDGHYSSSDENLAGQMLMGSLGLSYSLGKDELHGDWAIIEPDNLAEIEELDKRIGELETMMNDADKDGVPDYLDIENNSIAGVAVDTKGRMVDMNRNGIPDELEKYVDKSVATGVDKGVAANNSEVIKRLINEGYIAVFFDFGSSRPTPASTQNVAFILNYMRTNPSATAEITGYADEIGSNEVNNVLASKRANFLKETLVRAGIDGSRMTIISGGEDPSVDKKSEMARRLVRKAVFTIK